MISEHTISPGARSVERARTISLAGSWHRIALLGVVALAVIL